MAIGSIYRPFLEVLRESGVDLDGALAELGIGYAELVEGGVRLTPEQGQLLARMFARMPVGVPLGLRAAERFALSDADLLGYVMRSAPDALAAVEALAQHARLVGDSADFRIERSAGRVTLKLALSGGRKLLPEGADFAVAVIFKLIAEHTVGRVVPLEVRLPRERPRAAAAYARFFGVPVSFAADVAALIYAEASLGTPLVSSDRQLARILGQHARSVAASLPPADDWLATVRAYIAEDLARGAPSLTTIARRCAASERTIRRRLAALGTSYRVLVDDVRKERALALLADRQAVSAVAQQLGFADATGFARAFRRWTGRSPHEAV